MESVPHIFPKDWLSPENYNGLTPSQKTIYNQLANSGVYGVTGPEIQRIIEIAKRYKAKCG